MRNKSLIFPLLMLCLISSCGEVSSTSSPITTTSTSSQGSVTPTTTTPISGYKLEWVISEFIEVKVEGSTNLPNNITYENNELYFTATSTNENYIVENGTYDSADACYSMVLGITYSTDNSSKYTRAAYYYVDDNEITLDFLIDDGACWAYFWLDENVSGSYYWSYFDNENYEMNGILDANTYDSNTLLGYSDNNITSSTTRDSIRELASAMISVLCSWMDDDFRSINVTAEDLGFYCY